MSSGSGEFGRWGFFNAVFPTDDVHLWASSGQGHLTMAISPSPVAAGRLFFHSAPGRIVPEGTDRVGDAVGTWFRVYPSGGGSVFMGHLVLIWTASGHTYGLGFHGWTEDSRTMGLAMIHSLTVVSP
jgi:hypothetical protein